MSFDTDKCVVLHRGTNNAVYQYTLNGIPLKITECDIGVFIQPSLKPSHQIAESVKKANCALEMIIRNLTFLGKHHYSKLY